MEKKFFENAEIEVIKFLSEDFVTMSGGNGWDIQSTDEDEFDTL